MTKEELRSEWADRIAAYRSSGQTQHAWCTTQDVSIHQLKYWLYKNKEEITPKDLISHWLPLNVSRH